MVFASSAFHRGVEALSQGNYAEAYCQWKPLALNGNAEAQYNLGWLFANGNGMNVDTETAVYWWKNAAAQGHQDAIFAVGMAYITGEGIKPDAKEALRWFSLAAVGGMKDAQEIITQLSTDPKYKVLEYHPELLEQAWFGRSALVTANKANVREERNTKSTILKQLAKGATVRVVGEAGDWLMIVVNNKKTGWVYKPLLKITDNA